MFLVQVLEYVKKLSQKCAGVEALKGQKGFPGRGRVMVFHCLKKCGLWSVCRGPEREVRAASKLADGTERYLTVRFF